VPKSRFFTLRFLLLSAEDLNTHEKYVETADTWSISLLYSIDVKIPLIDTICAVSVRCGYGEFHTVLLTS
jgi:hypothetical protein